MSLHALELAVAAQRLAEQSSRRLDIRAARRREDVVARIVGQRGRQPAHVRFTAEVRQARRARGRVERDFRRGKGVTQSGPEA